MAARSESGRGPTSGRGRRSWNCWSASPTAGGARRGHRAPGHQTRKYSRREKRVAKLADFGLAKLFEGTDADAPTRTMTAARTRPGAIIGTVAYMSPEQAWGNRSTPAATSSRSAWCSTNCWPDGSLAGPTSLEVLQRIQHQPPAPLTEAVPAALRAVVEKALEKDPAARYQSMRELVVDLRRLVRHTTEMTAPATKVSRAWLGIAAALLLVTVVVPRCGGRRARTPRAPHRSGRSPCCRFRSFSRSRSGIFCRRNDRNVDLEPRATTHLM